jgi:hypothetical protein
MRDARGALVHVRTQSGECIGCIEVGLFEIVRQVIEDERGRRSPVGNIASAAAPTCNPAPILTPTEGDPC